MSIATLLRDTLGLLALLGVIYLWSVIVTALMV